MKLICIACPMGCELEVEKENVTGNQCARGAAYAKSESTNPARVVTALMRLKTGRVVSVRTSAPVPKAMVEPVVAEILSLRPAAVKHGQVIKKNILNTNADVIVTGY